VLQARGVPDAKTVKAMDDYYKNTELSEEFKDFLSQCDTSAFGKGSKTVTDLSVRNALQIDSLCPPHADGPRLVMGPTPRPAHRPAGRRPADRHQGGARAPERRPGPSPPPSTSSASTVRAASSRSTWTRRGMSSASALWWSACRAATRAGTSRSSTERREVKYVWNEKLNKPLTKCYQPDAPLDVLCGASF
jgi:hypothetical protein